MPRGNQTSHTALYEEPCLRHLELGARRKGPPLTGCCQNEARQFGPPESESMQDTEWVAEFARRNRVLKGQVFVVDPQTQAFVQSGTSSPVRFHRSAVVRAGGQAIVVRGRQDKPKLSPVAVRVQSADHVTTQYRRISSQVQQLAATDPVVAAGQVRCHQIFLTSLSRSEYLPVGDVRRLGDPEARIEVWVEVMDWHDQSLHDILADHNASPFGGVLEAVRAVLPLLNSLARCHDAGLVHRDIDAHNIMVAKDGTLLLTDWGAASMLDDNTTRTTNTAGKMHMLPPELIDTLRGPVQWYNDSWNLGYVLCQILLGKDQHPHRRPGAQRYDSPLLTSLPKPVRDVLERLLESDPSGRLSPHSAASALADWVLAQTQENLLLVQREMATAAQKAQRENRRAARFDDRRLKTRKGRAPISHVWRRPPHAVVTAIVGLVFVTCGLLIGRSLLDGPRHDNPAVSYPSGYDEKVKPDLQAAVSDFDAVVENTFVHSSTAASARLISIDRVDSHLSAKVQLEEIAGASTTKWGGLVTFSLSPLKQFDSPYSPTAYLVVVPHGEEDVTFVPAETDAKSIATWWPVPVGGTVDSFGGSNKRPTATFRLPDAKVNEGEPYPGLLVGVLLVGDMNTADPHASELAAVSATFISQMPETAN